MKESQRQTAQREFEAPTIAQLALSLEPVYPHTPVKDLLARFQSRADQPILPVIDELGTYLGTLSRRSLLGFMTKAFAMDLFLHRNVGELLKQQPELGATPMLAKADERVDQTMRGLLLRDPNMEHEALPVLEGGRLLGVVTVTDMMLSLSESQEKLIDVMHTLSARLNEEVAHAALLQRSLLPPAEVSLPGLRGTATLITSTEVGGDYYDYYCVDKRWSVLLIGDVSGHGVAAGTLVSAAKAGVNLLSAVGERDPGSILGRLNHAMLKIANQRLLMTLFVACLDTHTGELLYANAGHQFPYLYRYAHGAMETLEVGGLPLGKSPASAYSSSSTHLEVGDRLFFYTDGILEEENGEEEPFGYDRLEELLSSHFDHEPGLLSESLLAALRQFTGKSQYQDDVTVFCLEHHERIPWQTEASAPASEHELGLVRVAESFYRANTERLIPRLSRQNLVFLAEHGFSDLLGRFARDGIRRVLPRHNPTIARLGWKKLLAQHQPSRGGDLETFLPKPAQAREFQLRHSADKEFIIEETQAWLEESGLVDEERQESVIMLVDELVENGLYAAPRDGKGRPLYIKGEDRALAKGETVRLRLAMQDGLLGVHLLDSWGTLTPAVFLNRLVCHTQEGGGLIAGVGGAGLYLVWRLCDYLQFRVHPNQQTQATVLLDLKAPPQTDTDKGFQFIYHSEIHENIEPEPFLASHCAQAGD
jgi:serine phosphatase RsbU (regulator of sigma subunit)